MDNKEYVLEKLALNYAGTFGRFLAKIGNKDAKKVIDNFKQLHSIALEKGYTTESFGKFIKKMKRDPEVAKYFIADSDRAAAALAAKNAAGEGAEKSQQWAIFKPWSKKAKVGASLAAGAGLGGGAYYLMKDKNQPTEEELIYQQMMQQQGQMR